MEYKRHEVDFKKYCKLCKHEDKSDFEDPCNDCLDEPVNDESRKPLYFKEKEK